MKIWFMWGVIKFVKCVKRRIIFSRRMVCFICVSFLFIICLLCWWYGLNFSDILAFVFFINTSIKKVFLKIFMFFAHKEKPSVVKSDESEFTENTAAADDSITFRTSRVVEDLSIFKKRPFTAPKRYKMRPIRCDIVWWSKRENLKQEYMARITELDTELFWLEVSRYRRKKAIQGRYKLETWFGMDPSNFSVVDDMQDLNVRREAIKIARHWVVHKLIIELRELKRLKDECDN